MNVCVCVCVCLCEVGHAYADVCMNTRIIYGCVCMYVCVYVCVHVRLDMPMQMCV